MATVLYVEDEETDVLFMQRAFEEAGLEGCLQVVGDGQAALDYLAGRGSFAERRRYPLPGVVLLDLNLPMLSGFQVLEWIRAQQPLRELPVVIFSSSARPEDRTQARQLGANGYVEKPDSGLKFGIVLDELRRYLPVQVRAPAPPAPVWQAARP